MSATLTPDAAEQAREKNDALYESLDAYREDAIATVADIFDGEMALLMIADFFTGDDGPDPAFLAMALAAPQTLIGAFIFGAAVGHALHARDSAS